MFFDKIFHAQKIIAKHNEQLTENRNVYEAILQFYSDNALIETSIFDLKALLKNKTIKVYKTSANTFKDCVYNLLDNHSELTAAKGMLRYYEAPENFNWIECEKAEIAFGDALTQDIYGFEPDFFTVFKSNCDVYKLTIILAV